MIHVVLFILQEATPPPPPGISSIWAFPTNSGAANGSHGPPDTLRLTNGTSGYAGGVAGPEIFTEEEDPCAICHEEMEHELNTLQCGHTFHDLVNGHFLFPTI